MESRIRIYADGGNRSTKIMQELKKPFSYPTMVSQPEMDLNFGLNFDVLDLELESNQKNIESMLVEIIKDGESLGKKLVGKSAENKGLLIRDRNRYQKKAGDAVIIYCILAGIAYDMQKYNKNNEKIDLTINQPLIEYAMNKQASAMKYEKNLKGNIKVIFYNIYNTFEAVSEVTFAMERITFCPEAIATFFQYAITEDGTVKKEYNDHKKTIVWDIGSGQMNVVAFEGLRTAGLNTFEKGMMDCYEKISMILYNNYRDRLDRKPYTHEIDNMIRYNHNILKAKKGEEIDTSTVVNNVLDTFAYEISKDVREFAKSKFLGNSDTVIFSGGGSEILFQDLERYLGTDFICTKSNLGEYDNVIGSMYYRMYRDQMER